MEINDIIRLMQAVSENGLTSFKMEEGNLKLSIKKEEKPITVTNLPVGNFAAEAPAVTAAIQAAGNPVAAIVPEVSQANSTPAVGENVSGVSTGLETDKVVSSPLVGTFYNASSPDADPFVKVGDTVKKGQVLGIIEAMKLMNEIESEFDGVVEAVLVGNEDVVEYGQPLFRIR